MSIKTLVTGTYNDSFMLCSQVSGFSSRAKTLFYLKRARDNYLMNSPINICLFNEVSRICDIDILNSGLNKFKYHVIFFESVGIDGEGLWTLPLDSWAPAVIEFHLFYYSVFIIYSYVFFLFIIIDLFKIFCLYNFFFKPMFHSVSLVCNFTWLILYCNWVYACCWELNCQ